MTDDIILTDPLSAFSAGVDALAEALCRAVQTAQSEYSDMQSELDTVVQAIGSESRKNLGKLIAAEADMKS